MRVSKFQGIVVDLLSRRRRGVGVTSDEEGKIAEQLDGIWREMCLDEQLAIDAWVRGVVGT